MNSGKLNFNQAKQIVYSYVQQPDIWQELVKYVAKNQSIYQYIYLLLLPLNYLQSNKYGIKVRNGFSLCYSEWLNDKFKKEQEKKYLAKNLFNFAVYEKEKRHPFEQKPIADNFVVKNLSNKKDDKHKSDVVDSSNKENIPPIDAGYKYSPTMVDLKRNFDKNTNCQQLEERS